MSMDDTGGGIRRPTQSHPEGGLKWPYSNGYPCAGGFRFDKGTGGSRGGFKKVSSSFVPSLPGLNFGKGGKARWPYERTR